MTQFENHCSVTIVLNCLRSVQYVPRWLSNYSIFVLVLGEISLVLINICIMKNKQYPLKVRIAGGLKGDTLKIAAEGDYSS